MKLTFLKNYFRQQIALQHRNYRLYLGGQCLSLIGTWMQRIAMIWLAYQLTHSAFLLGVIGFCEQIPVFLIAPFAGVYADRWNKHRALIRIETLAIIQAILLGILTLTQVIEVWHLIALSLFLGVINAFEVPMRQAFVVDMVDKDKAALSNAIALNSTIFNLSRLVGPAMAGFLISIAGEGWCFMANGFSYGIVTVFLLMMRITVKMPVKTGDQQVFRKLKEGIRYISNKTLMRSLLFLLAIVSFSNAALRTLAPIFAEDILHGDADTLGFLMSAVGVGAITGALYLTRNRSTDTLSHHISLTGFIVGGGLIFFGASQWLWVSLLFLAIAGFGRMLHTASTNTLLQWYTDDDKRGRVMSFYTVCLQGMMPFGSLAAGALASLTSASWSMVIMGATCVAGAFIFRKDLAKKSYHPL